ncbi:hypothetical protein [Glacieibacterium sp.]|uniref:hypothetical protein n=1 Tax=Glacieibacterium sp. TaxID=2860237 RepID=UPI003AFFFBC2
MARRAWRQGQRGGRDHFKAKALDQRRAQARADDLRKAEAVDRGALERRRQIRVEELAEVRTRRLVGDGREVDADRAGDAEAPDRLCRRDRRRLGQRAQLAGAVDIDDGHRRGRGDGQQAAGEGDVTGGSGLGDFAPAGGFERIVEGEADVADLVPGARQPLGEAGAMRDAARPTHRAGLGADLGELGAAGLGDGFADDLDADQPAFGQPGGQRLEQRLDAAGLDDAALAGNQLLDQPGGPDVADAQRLVVALDMRLDDSVVFDDDGAGLADAVVDQRLRHRGPPP